MQIKQGYEDITSDKTKYYLNGISYPRVSTILANIDKRPLVKWAVRVGCDKIQELSSSDLDFANIIEQGKNEHIRLFTEAQEYGTLVHDKIECWLKKCKEPKSKHPKKWIDLADISLESFIDFWQYNKFELIKSEMAVINKELKYGGRIDILAKQGGDTVLLDVKTSKSIWKSAKIQCGLYAMALEEMIKKRIKKENIQTIIGVRPCRYYPDKISKAIILHIPKLNPKVKPIEVIDDEFEYAKKAGLDLVSLYYNLKGIK